MAVRSFYRALIEYGAWSHYRFYTAGALVGAAREQIETLTARRSQRSAAIGVHPQLRLASDIQSGILSAYHEPNLAGDALFALRRSLGGRGFPITLLNHSFSYRSMLHGTLLRLLLDAPRAYDSVICSSQAARHALSELLLHIGECFESEHGVRLTYRGRMDVIPLGVDTNLWRPRDRSDLRAQLGLPDDAMILLFLGRLSISDKADLRPLIEVFARLRQLHRDRSLLLILAGTERDGETASLQAQIAESGLRSAVRILIDPSAPHLLMGAADVFVSPADNVQEAFGLTPVEAMASGIPQVVADWDGYRETVVDGQTGFRIPTLWASCVDDLMPQSPLLAREWLDHTVWAQSVAVDTESLLLRLNELVAQPALRQQMGEASRARALREYAWPVIIARYEALWQELSERAHRDQQAARPEATYSDTPLWRAFSHYATRALRPDESLRLTAAGRDVVDGERLLPASHHAELCSASLAGDALRLCAEAGTCCSLEDIEKQASALHRCDVSRVRRHVLWLLKHGLLSLAST
jgi:glycosyltransferase involved in cell wall biosynthesis